MATPTSEPGELFTPDEVASINAFQRAGVMHPFTCTCGETLVARAHGLHCPKCDYVQTWVHGFMRDWSWRRVRPGWPGWLPDASTQEEEEETT